MPDVRSEPRPVDRRGSPPDDPAAHSGIRRAATLFARWVLGPPLFLTGFVAILFIPFVGARLVIRGMAEGHPAWTVLGLIVGILWVALFGATLWGLTVRREKRPPPVAPPR